MHSQVLPKKYQYDKEFKVYILIREDNTEECNRKQFTKIGL